MFYDKFAKLCAENKTNPSRVVVEIGMSNSLPSKWKRNGSTPEAETIQKISNYFGIGADYFMTDGAASDAAYWAYEVQKLDKEYRSLPDGPDKQRVGADYDFALNQYKDAQFVISTENRKAPVESDEGEYLEQLRNSPNTRALLHTIRYMNEEQIGAYAHFAEQIRKGGWNGKED